MTDQHEELEYHRRLNWTRMRMFRRRFAAMGIGLASLAVKVLWDSLSGGPASLRSLADLQNAAMVLPVLAMFVMGGAAALPSPRFGSAGKDRLVAGAWLVGVCGGAYAVLARGFRGWDWVSAVFLIAFLTVALTVCALEALLIAHPPAAELEKEA